MNSKTKIDNILNIKNSKIRVFPFQTRDHAFILYPDLPSSYLLSLLIDKADFNISQFKFSYIYPTQKIIRRILSQLSEYREDYFIFYLENYFHSSDYAFGFLEMVLKEMKNRVHKSKVIVHSIKTPGKDILNLLEEFESVILVVTGDLEEFFYDIFVEKKEINKISNIFYRDDVGEIKQTEKKDITTDLNKYLQTAYYGGYYSFFPKVKDYIISILDDDDETTNDTMYYKWPRDKFIRGFRYQPETWLMLATGRGCKYNCSYCYRGVKYSKIRQISLENLKKDLDYLKEMKYEYVYFYDDCFITTNLDRLDDVVDLLNQYDFEYGISSRFEICTEENIKKISSLKISRIQIGLQSVSLEVNKNTKRGFVKKDFEKALKDFGENNIEVSLDIILGLPGEGLKGFIKTFNYAVQMKPKSIFINTLFLNPGTDLYNNKSKYGIKTNSKNGRRHPFHVDGILSSNDFSQKDIEVAKKYVGFYIKKINDINIVMR